MIPLCEPMIKGNEWKYIKECLDTNWISSVGSYVDLFEKNFKEYMDSEFAIVTMNGTSALTLALQCIGIGQDDEVIVPSMTFVASVNPIIYVGAKPVFIDITSDTWVMDVTKIEETITEKTKAILPVHLYGNMVDMEMLMYIANKYGLFVIEDATEALGSEYRMSNDTWHKAGTMGHFGAFSFNGNKIITTGAGGMLVTNDALFGERAKYLSNQAKTLKENGAFCHNDIGYNYRMPNILAAMGVAQLENLPKYLKSKVEIATLYDKFLESNSYIKLSAKKNNIKNCNWLYSILIENANKRNELIKYLKQNDVTSRPFFYPIHSMKPYKNYKSFNMHNTFEISQRGINLPSSVGLSRDTIFKISDLLNRYFEV